MTKSRTPKKVPVHRKKTRTRARPKAKVQKKSPFTKIGSIVLLVIFAAWVSYDVFFKVSSPKEINGGITKNNATTTPTVVPTPVPVAPKITFVPPEIVQGEPFRVAIEGVHATSSVKSLTFRGVAMKTFIYEGKVGAIGAIDLNGSFGDFEVRATLLDGTAIKGILHVKKRPLVRAPFGIPDKLGGNTPEGQVALVNNLASEAEVIRNIPSASVAIWQGPFRPPLNELIVTDKYGYSRETGPYAVSHKGTDFRAAERTPIFAMNDGVAVMVREFKYYGNIVVLDHGAGVQTLYLHLSEQHVKQGDRVVKGQQIGLSGSTGYAEVPHLHLSVKVKGLSIDPMKFMEMMR